MKVQGETTSYLEDLAKIINKDNYTKQKILKAAFYWKKMPSRLS